MKLINKKYIIYNRDSYFYAYFHLKVQNNFNQFWIKNVIIHHQFGEQKLISKDQQDLKE